MAMKFHKVSWEELEKQCLELALKTKNTKINRIICISRGGLVWARMLSDLLSIPVSHLTVESYADLKQIKTPIVTESPTHLPERETWLVVDEICDTGNTFKVVIDHLKKIRTKKIYTLAPIIKSHSKFIPDFWVEKIDAWVIFPYELRETYESFLKVFKSKNEALDALKKNFQPQKVDSVEKLI
ncbi:MAG: phosphoribosyltransferase [Patescibacteria group bacterium]